MGITVVLLCWVLLVIWWLKNLQDKQCTNNMLLVISLLSAMDKVFSKRGFELKLNWNEAVRAFQLVIALYFFGVDSLVGQTFVNFCTILNYVNTQLNCISEVCG